MEKLAHFSRRSVLKSAGALVVSIGMPLSLDAVLAVNVAHAQGAKPPLTPDQLSSFIAVNSDGSISAYFGKMDMGQGLFTSIGQIVAEELDVPFNRVKVIMGDTATSVDMGGASGSTGIQNGGKQMRVAAAEARRVLVEMAAQKFGVTPDRLIVVDGIVRMRDTSDDTTNSVSYADLIGGKYFNVELQWNKQLGNALYAPGMAMPKKPADYKVVGKPIPREDIAPIVYCQQDFVTGRASCAREGRSRGDRAQGMGCHQGCRGAEGAMVGHQPAVPLAGRNLQSHPQGECGEAAGRQADRRYRGCVQDSREGDRGRIRMAVPVPFQHGTGVRCRGYPRRPAHHLYRIAKAAPHPQRGCERTQYSGRARPVDLDARTRLLRPQRCRRCCR
jgi:hypothetical protein